MVPCPRESNSRESLPSVGLNGQRRWLPNYESMITDRTFCKSTNGGVGRTIGDRKEIPYRENIGYSREDSFLSLLPSPACER